MASALLKTFTPNIASVAAKNTFDAAKIQPQTNKEKIMQFTTQTPTEYKIHNIATITVCIPANDDEIAPNAPMRKDDMWEIDINVDSKSVNNWPTGETMNLSACVADSGCYYLKTIFF